MDQETRELLESCARLRAGGDSWEEVSAILKRPVTELKDITWQHRAEWAALFIEAAGLMALEILADLAHGDDAHVAADAAKTLLTHSRWNAESEPQRHGDTEGGRESTDYTDYADNSGNMQSVDGGSLCPPDDWRASLGGEEKAIAAGEAATEKLVELLRDEKSWVALRAAQSILVLVRWRWDRTHPRPRAPRERKPRGPDWKSILPWESGEPEPDEARNVSIYEDAAQFGKPGRLVSWMGRRNGELVSWEKTGAEAQAYIAEIVKAPEKPAAETIWYGRWRGTRLVWLPERETVPWPPPEEVLAGRWYNVWDEAAEKIEVKPLPDSWKAGEAEPDDGWGPQHVHPPSRASPD